MTVVDSHEGAFPYEVVDLPDHRPVAAYRTAAEAERFIEWCHPAVVAA